MAVTINASTTAGLVQTADTSGVLALQTAGTTAVTVDASQNVGIGTSSPQTKLDVSGGSLRINEDGAGTKIITVRSNFASVGPAINVTTNDPLLLMTNNTERARIDTSGNVGIGTTSPSTFGLLAVKKDQIADTAITVSNQGTSNAATTMSFVLNEAGTPQGWFRRYRDGTGNTEVGFGDALLFTGNVTSTKAERARIDSSGNLLVGTTSQPISGFTAKLCITTVSAQHGTSIFVTGNQNIAHLSQGNATNDYYFGFFQNNANTNVGNIRVTASSTAYNTSSDYRLKDDIAPMNNALSKVAALKPVTYKWKSTGEFSQGFIAHELQTVVPECVSGEKDAVDAEGKPQYQGIDTSFLVATLTAAIQEQQALITQLQADVASLKGASA